MGQVALRPNLPHNQISVVSGTGYATSQSDEADHDHYGICLECDEPISAKRLEAVPWARYCVACQERIAARIAEGEVIDEYQQADR